MNPIISTLVYFAVGMFFCAIGYKLFDWIVPLDLNKEIDDHNVAVGIAIAGMFIGIAIVISAALL